MKRIIAYYLEPKGNKQNSLGKGNIPQIKIIYNYSKTQHFFRQKKKKKKDGTALNYRRVPRKREYSFYSNLIENFFS